MKIILTNKETERFLSFVGTQLRLNADMYTKACPSDVAELEGKTNDDLIQMTFGELVVDNSTESEEGVSINKVIKVYKLGDDENILEVKEELFLAYTECMADTLDVMTPYSLRVMDSIVKHQKALENLPKKFRALNTLIERPMIKKGLLFAADMLGIREFAVEAYGILHELFNNEEEMAKLDAIEDKFRDAVRNNIEEV